MEINEFLRSKRLKRGLTTYAAMAEKATTCGYTTSAQALNKAERIPQYITQSTKDMYVDVLSLTSEEADMLDVLAARCQIRKGSNTNPYMTVVDTRTYTRTVDSSCDMVMRLLNDILARKSSLTVAEEELLRTAIKGALCRPLNLLKEGS